MSSNTLSSSPLKAFHESCANCGARLAGPCEFDLGGGATPAWVTTACNNIAKDQGKTLTMLLAVATLLTIVVSAIGA